jgi:hypothetical protein
VSPGNAADDPATAPGASVKTRHLGRCAGLIDEDELCRARPTIVGAYRQL